MPRVLSIQSHVVSGYVGNKSATFPLQLLGWDVDVLNTVQFSNHLGYGDHGGSRMSNDHLISCIDGLDRNGLLRYDALLTGFTLGPEGIDALMYSIRKIKPQNPCLLYLVDPVMGDDGKLYVSEQVPPKYKELLKLATIATPNQFEAQILTGHSTNTIPEIRACLKSFHDLYGLQHVVITSISIPIQALEKDHQDLPEPDFDGSVLVCVGSTMEASDQPWLIAFPKRNRRYDGVGDLFASMLLGRLVSRSGPTADLSQATQLALASTQAVLDLTDSTSSTTGLSNSECSGLAPKAVQARSSELRIIQSRRLIENPPVIWKAVPL